MTMTGTPYDDSSDDESFFDDNETRESRGHEKKLSVILLFSLIAVWTVARQVIPMTKSMSSDGIDANSHKITDYKITTTNSIRASASSSKKLTSIIRTPPPLEEESMSSSDEKEKLTPASLPIYLFQSSNNQTARTTWDTINKTWNRTTHYTDLFSIAKPIPSLPSSPTILLFRRPVVMIHCGPKTGSTTLRTACKNNLETTCGVKNKKGGKHEPEGYMDESKLYPLIRRCTNTSHFCAKEVDMPPSFEEVPPFDDVLFVHMFPFRNYDEWAASALKQTYVRNGEMGCNKTQKMFDECRPSRMEIDFRKYGKTELSRFKSGVLERMREEGVDEEDHVFVLYHHRELHHVLAVLSTVYGVPLLPGSDGKGKEKRPEGTCSNVDGILDTFHNCFSEKLTELT